MNMISPASTPPHGWPAAVELLDMHCLFGAGVCELGGGPCWRCWRFECGPGPEGVCGMLKSERGLRGQEL